MIRILHSGRQMTQCIATCARNYIDIFSYTMAILVD